MANQVLVMTDNSFSATTLTAQLTTMNNTTPITLVVVGGENQAEAAAALWAQNLGIPWVAHGHYMDGAGLNQFARGVFLLNKTNPDQVVTAGTTAKPTATAAAATLKGKTLTKL